MFNREGLWKVSEGEQAAPERIETMIAFQALLRNGFIAVPYGDNPAEPDELGFVKMRWGIHEIMRVYSEDEAGAVRLVGGVSKEKAEGKAVDVVRTVLGWPRIVSVNGDRI
ncbi:hypothetical protein SAMN05216188_104244 [Lentzea xinjiangensis]|uniref:Uncharacterized protein n=1 Tax=Lentzea xinjiangensis TaxID=402600 RepID=A0A1H9HXA6_9PSEU|nr:hypothetical protein [Lentzea xinjiangensis]SEQ66971.1 hypothetical protein SAMN05216188_104244 [Lentzea xinjiangensis]